MVELIILKLRLQLIEFKTPKLEAPKSPLAVTMATKRVYFKGCLRLPAEVDLVHCITEISLPIWSPWRLYCSLANWRHLGRCIREFIASDVLWIDRLVANLVAYVYMVTISCHPATVWRLPLNSFPWWRNKKDCLNVQWRNGSVSRQSILVYLLNDDSWGLRGGVWKQIWYKKSGFTQMKRKCCFSIALLLNVVASAGPLSCTNVQMMVKGQPHIAQAWKFGGESGPLHVPKWCSVGSSVFIINYFQVQAWTWTWACSHQS